ncbi:MAG: undecaprenyl-phosphate galactose phosphotransferase WbaP [Chloroflexi bacterium]|nr:undecaprenyl-phosphate galactose phosphotransferase WbaP [Chloroflexota bacterium]
MAAELLTGINDITFTLPGKRKGSILFDKYARSWMIGMLMLADFGSLLAAMVAAFYFRLSPDMVNDSAYDQLFGLLAIMVLILFSRKGLYPAVGMHYVDELGQIVSSTSLAFLVMISVTFIFKNTQYYSRLILIIAWALSLVFIPLIRYVLRRILIRWQLWGEPVVIIGEYSSATKLCEYFTLNSGLGLRPVAVFRDDNSSDKKPMDFNETERLAKIQASKYSIKTALIVIDNLNDIDLLVERFRNVFQRLILIKDKQGRFGLDSLVSLDFLDILGLQVKNNLYSASAKFLKRFIDVLVTVFGIVILSPLLFLIAIMIKIDSPGKVFYRQIRLGKQGRPLVLLKFRTMHQNADDLLSNELARDPKLKNEWDRYQKLKIDPRVTRVGRILRKFSLDELPQLWNVVRGEMSLVGPRPIMVSQREIYGKIIQDYVQVAPGITGLWQVSGRNQTTFLRRAELDREYIQRWSPWLDIFILLKTIKVVLLQNGAY